MNCPHCNHWRAQRIEKRVRCLSGKWTNAGYYVCLQCWHAWDGVTQAADGILPFYVTARKKPEDG